MKNIFKALLLLPYILVSQTYISEYEEKIFTSLDNDISNDTFFKSLLAIDSSMTNDTYLKYKSKVDDVIVNLPEMESKEKKRKSESLKFMI